MNLSDSLAIISIAGFAVQRTLELLDPIFAGAILSWKKLQKGSDGKLPFDLTETIAKTWLMALFAFLISIPIALVSKTQLLGTIDPNWSWVDSLISALAISAGSNGLNSVLKFAELAKASRKVEVQPLPEVKVSPSTATIKPTATIDILASVAGADNKDVKWRVLEGQTGGEVNSDPETPSIGKYKAPTAAGEYHVAAISKANSSAVAIAIIKVVV